ncbi:hypothetical protein PVE54_001088 [Salmonella enterica]|nr:hypothetical protein [Salmonella enterica]
MQQLTFFSEWSNILGAFFIISFIICFFIAIIEKTNTIIDKIFFGSVYCLASFIIGWLTYMNNYTDSDPLYQDRNTFKKHEHKIPTERNFYLSGFLNNSSYFKTKNGEKMFKPIKDKDFKLTDNENSTSFSYTNNYIMTKHHL